MNREAVIQIACIYGPIIGAVMLALFKRPDKRSATGLLFALCWVAALLPWLDLFSQSSDYWHYEVSGPRIGGMPLSLYFGWIIGWGIFAPLLASTIGGKPWLAAAIVTLLDLRLMPELSPVIQLGSNWWIGELVMILILLLPSIWIAEATRKRTHTPIRASMLIPAFGGIILGIPFILLCPVSKAIDLFHPIWIPAAVLASLPGLIAVRDLALSGDGTPVPLDPPRHLVDHGIYAYCRNPMQCSMTALLLLESAFLSNIWPAVIAVLGAFYSEGLARWSEQNDMSRRFGDNWKAYHKAARPWFPRWKPIDGKKCELWIDLGCPQCSSMNQWFEKQEPVGLVLKDARNWPGEPLYRMTWHDPVSGRRESGIRGVAMGFQHINIMWAFLGWIISLPVISNLIQVCFDVAGAGPRQAGSQP